MEVQTTEVWSYLSDVEYPASKLDVITTAERQGARQQLIEVLQALPGERFAEPEELQAALRS